MITPDLGTVLSCSSFCTTFPRPIAREVMRDALMNQIDDLFLDGISLIRLDGKVDIGKTRFLCQFVARHPDQTISTFIRAESWYLHHPSFLYADVASQMFWALHGTEPPENFNREERAIRTMSFDLQRKAKKLNQLFYFVIDGVENIASGPEQQLLPCLLRLLPMEYSQFRFLTSGDASWVPFSTLPQAQRKTLTVTGFSFLETSCYLDGLGLDLKQVEEIYRNCGRGIPGLLASARRSLESGLKANDLIDKLSEELQQSFSIEWASQAVRDSTGERVLAILAHDNNPHSVRDLTEILGISSDSLIELLKPCTFLEIPPDPGPVLYVSESFRRFAAKQLVHLEESTWNTLAEHYSTASLDKKSDLLPRYFQQAGRAHELLTLLSAKAFTRIAEQSESLLPVQQRSDLGFTTALELKRYDEMLRFQLQSAVAADISQFRFSELEVIARLSLDDYPTALALAKSASLKRTRLELMAAIARAQKEKGLTPEPTLTQAVETLVQQIEPRELGDELVKVASDLMFIRAELALSLVSRLAPNVTDNKDVDRALLRMATVAAHHSHADAGMSAALEDIQSRISSTKTRTFARTLSLLLRNLSPADILKQVRSIENAGDQLFLLREWCARCKNPESAAAVVDYAVHLAIRTTEYLPSASDLKAFSEPIPRLSSTDDIASLITSLDLQKEAAKNVGPTQEYVSWQLLLAQAEQRISALRAGQRLFEIYEHVSEIIELDVKVVCLGLIVAAVPRIDPSGVFEDTTTIAAISEEEFVGAYKMLLGATADHYKLSKPIIEAVASSRPDLALDVIQQINYEKRQDAALDDLVEHLTDCDPLQISIQTLFGLLGRWHDPEEEDRALDKILTATAGIDEQTMLLEQWPSISGIIERSFKVQSCFLRCRIFNHVLMILNKASHRTHDLYPKVVSQLRLAWIAITDPEAKLCAGYLTARRIADHDRDLALEFLRLTDEEKRGYTDLSNSTYICSLRLVIRAFSGLLPRNLDRQSDLSRLTTLIEKVPSPIPKIYLWTDLVLRIDSKRRGEATRDIVLGKILPLLETVKERCVDEWFRASSIAAPALYRFSPAVATQHLKGLPIPSKDTAYDNVLRYLTTGVPSTEPFKSSGANYNLGYDRCVEVLTVAENIDIDFLVYRYIAIVVKAARWDHNRFAPSQQQKNELARTIRELSANKFPSRRGIRHEGFAILAEAQANTLLREKGANWDNIIKRARALTNEADRAFVLMHIAEVIHSGRYDEKRALLEEAHQVSLAIPAALDRVERLNILAEIQSQHNPVQAKAIVKEAAETLRGKSEDRADELCRNVVDLAYQIDPEFASSLTSILDNDRGRRIARSRLAYQKAKECWSKDDEEDSPDSAFDLERMGQVAWDLLGSVNADRLQLKGFKECVEVLRRIHGTPLKAQFAIFSWALENLIRRRAAAEEAGPLLRGVFESLLTGSEVAAVLISRAAGSSVSFSHVQERVSDSVLIRAGQREQALDHLVAWLSDKPGELLYICDPYFGRTELEVVKLVMNIKPELRVRILTSRRKQEQDVGNPSLELEEAYRRYWRQNFSEQAPNDCEVIVIGDNSGALPIHDRWWLVGKAGLRMGTSFNQLGVNKDSEISSF